MNNFFKLPLHLADLPGDNFKVKRLYRTYHQRRLPVCRALVLLVMCALGTFCSRAAVVTEVFVDAVAQVESGGGRRLVGDGGKAQGAWQMHEDAWEDTTAFRKQQGLPVWNYSQARNLEVARIYARDYLSILERQLLSACGPNVTMELVYAAYNVGFSRFQSRGFRLDKTPSSTRIACARLAHLIMTAEAAARQSVAMAEVKQAGPDELGATISSGTPLSPSTRE